MAVTQKKIQCTNKHVSINLNTINTTCNEMYAGESSEFGDNMVNAII